MPATAPRKYTVLSPDEWKVIIQAYKLGTSTIGELSRTYGVSPRSIQNKVKEAGATRTAGFLPKAAPSGTSVGMPGAVHTVPPSPSSKPLTSAQRQKLVEDRIDAAIESAIVGSLNIEHTTARCVAILNSSGSTSEELHHAAAVLRSMERAVMILDRSDRIKRRALQMDAGNASVSIVLPELPIRDMTRAEYAAIRHRQAQEDNGVQFDDEGNPIVETALGEELVEDDRHAEGCDDEE